ncbi:hypothetical protein [Streptomyces cyaneofuscatus]|uniref:hypothetical protein n=1 Tax=Streptomyces cyaneofuscatus TaxID=66883 RepID=UPI00365B0F1F
MTAAAELGYAAFVERNTPRYQRYAAARLPSGGCTGVVATTLAEARARWAFILSQPSPAAEVWLDLRRRVSDVAERTVPSGSELAKLYERFGPRLADSVVLCRHLGLGVDEAAELMGAEASAVTANLAVTQRRLPDLLGGRPPLI